MYRKVDRERMCLGSCIERGKSRNVETRRWEKEEAREVGRGGILLGRWKERGCVYGGG